MKAKSALETLRAQLTSSLDVFSRFSSSEEIEVRYTFDETERLRITMPDKSIAPAFAIVVEAHQTIDGETKTRKLWLRKYPIVGSLNEVKYQAFKELFDIIIGNFIINATRASNKTLEDLSNIKN